THAAIRITAASIQRGAKRIRPVSNAIGTSEVAMAHVKMVTPRRTVVGTLPCVRAWGNTPKDGLGPRTRSSSRPRRSTTRTHSFSPFTVPLNMVDRHFHGDSLGAMPQPATARLLRGPVVVRLS